MRTTRDAHDVAHPRCCFRSAGRGTVELKTERCTARVTHRSEGALCVDLVTADRLSAPGCTPPVLAIHAVVTQEPRYLHLCTEHALLFSSCVGPVVALTRRRSRTN